MTAAAPCLLALLALGPQIRGLESQWREEAPSSIVTRIGADLAVVTEVSSLSPYLGQQVGVIYWLRARRAPAAVDIDPQQFPSLWTEPIPVPREPGSSMRGGKGYTEFLLRQVVAFPLVEGEVALPPLSLKIKTASRQSARRDDWDVVAASEAVRLQVRAVPGPANRADRLPLVGRIRAGIEKGTGEQYRRAILELEGSANLALFQPGAYLSSDPGRRLAARLLDMETRPQILDTGGRRRISVLTRQRWALQPSPLESGGWAVDGFVLPVFDPQEGAWTELTVPGVAFQPSAPGDTVTPEPPQSPDGSQSRPARTRAGALFAAIAVTAAILLTAAAARVIVKRASGRSRRDFRPAGRP